MATLTNRGRRNLPSSPGPPAVVQPTWTYSSCVSCSVKTVKGKHPFFGSGWESVAVQPRWELDGVGDGATLRCVSSEGRIWDVDGSWQESKPAASCV